MKNEVKVCNCRVLGTPTEDTWPGVSQLPEFKVLMHLLILVLCLVFWAIYVLLVSSYICDAECVSVMENFF